ncbi:MAG: bifunctional diguanylate cyclase/phosphodiesterase, partial [Chromatiales bacterium]|nr:bifunctional diguanylate cyclase/phosphodiesterase [Chromatiales bacterium]
KNINDSFGHEFGDKLLKALATRLLEIDPSLFVSRFGGDEFVIIAPGVETDEEALFLAQTILDKVELPIKLESIELVVSASLGISFYPRDGQDVGTLISRADTAMYRMKSERELQASIYSGVVSDQLSYFVSTENSIYKGIQERQFTNYYQPKVDMETGRIIGLEALIRWQHPDQGMVLPGRFIDVAEETGQIVEIGRMVLERTMHDIKEWMKAGVAVPVSVNVSARQFIGQMFTEQCMRRFDTREIEPSLVSLEVTEQVFLGDLENAKRQLQRFRDMGVSIALDDFGTGYSSLSYLMQLPIDTLKIDKSFIEDICIDERSRAILKVILGISNELGLSVVAEGVETDEQRRLLREMDCKVAQGFYFYKPMPANEIRALLVGQRARAMARPTFSRANYKPN